MREGNSPHLLQQVRKGRRETLQRQQPSATDPNRMMDAAPESSGSASSNQRNIAGPSAAQHPSCPTSLPGEDRSNEDSETKDLQRAARSCTSEQHSRSNSSSPRASHEANKSNFAPDLTNMAGKWEDKKAAQAKKPDDQRAKQTATETVEMCRRWSKGECRFGEHCCFRHAWDATQRSEPASEKWSKAQDASKGAHWSGWPKATWTSSEVKEVDKAVQSTSWPTAEEGQLYWNNKKWNKSWGEKQGHWKQDIDEQSLAEGIRQSREAWQDANNPHDENARGSGTWSAEGSSRTETATATARANKNSREAKANKTEAEGEAIKLQIGNKTIVITETTRERVQSTATILQT